jgi:hypothetical protein
MCIGREFYFGIPLTPVGQTPVFEVTIGTPNDQADYIMESNEGEIASGTVTSDAPATVTLDATLQVTQSGYVDREKGIRVRAINSSSVYVLVVMKHAVEYMETVDNTFLVYPNSKSSRVREYKYYAIAPDPNFNSYSNFLLVGGHDDTVVSLTPTKNIRLPEDIQTGSNLIDIENGTTHNITLESLQTLLVTSVFDLSGTKIVSNKPLTVISGHQCAQVSTTACHSAYVHLLPTFNWGREFILHSAQYYKLVSEENTPCCTRRLRFEGNVFSFQTRSPRYMLDMGFPVFLILVGEANDLAIVPPITGRVRSTSFTSLPSQYSNFMGNNYILVTVQSEHYNQSEIRIDGGPLDCFWIIVVSEPIWPGWRHKIGWLGTCAVSSGSHTVSHTAENGVLSALVYGWQRGPDIGYSYHPNNNIGMEIIIMGVGLSYSV